MKPALRELVRWLAELAIAEVTEAARARHAAAQGLGPQLSAAPARGGEEPVDEHRAKAAPRRRLRKR